MASSPSTGVPHSDLPRLRFLSGSRVDTEVVLTPERCTLGRSRRCELRLDSAVDTLVSGVHVAFGTDDGMSWWLEDLGSTNGTWLNGARVNSRLPIPAENEITLGKPKAPGSVTLYVAFPAQRRAAWGGRGIRDAFAEAGERRDTPSPGGA